jgi:SPP1 gp7 family putative phage head morphogenesis protein
MSKKIYQKLDDDVLKIALNREDSIRKSYQDSLNGIRQFWRGMVDRFGRSDGTIEFSELQKYGRFDAGRREIVKQVDFIYESALSDIKDDLREIYELSYNVTSGAIEATTGSRPAGALRLDALERAINTPVGGLTIDLRLDELQLRLQNSLTRSVTSGLSQGKGWNEIARDLRNDMQGNLSSIQRIVRTEGHRLEETAKYDTAKKSRKKLMKVWVSERDSAVRDWHRELDGTTIEMDAFFVSAVGGRGLYPSDMGVPEDDINCRCFVEYVEAPKD